MKPNLFVIALTLTSIVTFTSAQEDNQPATARAPRQPTKTLVYDIRGLLQSAGNKPEMIDSYIKLIEDTVNAETWRDNGGDLGMIRVIEGLLIVTQTDDAHRQLEELVTQLNDKQTRLVRVRAHWLTGTPEQLQLGGKSGGATREIDPNALDNLPKDVVHHRAETVCFSGQTVTMQSGSQHGYVSELNPVVGQQSVGYDPKIAMAQDGAEFRVTPAVQTDGKSAWLDIDSRVTQWLRPQGLDMKQVATSTTRPIQLGGETVIERPNIGAQAIHTSLRVPLGKAVIVGGMTVEPGLNAPNGPQMILIVEVFVD